MNADPTPTPASTPTPAGPTPTRRRFLQQLGAAGAAGLVVGAPALVRGRDLNSRLQVAAVGVDGMGLSDVRNIGGHERTAFVGFCEVDRRRFANADEAFPDVPHFADYREMLRELGDKVDAVSVSTPDHMHAPVSLLAMRLGKHVYCQKPLAHTVEEARIMREVAAETGVITQMGNQIHSAIEYRLATSLLRQRPIGAIREVHSWVGVGGNQYTRRLDPLPEASPPGELDWDLWIGAAPMRAYAPGYHPFSWRDWQDFGGGALGDFGCHLLDPVHTALGLGAPLSVKAVHSGINDQVWPAWQEVEFMFKGTEFTGADELKLVWHDGGRQPARQLAKMPDNLDLPRSGSLFVGEEGTVVLPHVGGPRLYPQEKFRGHEYPREQGFNHWHVWVDACLAGERTSDGFHYAGPLAETVLLGTVAARASYADLDRRGGYDINAPTLEWDAEQMRIPNLPEAERWLRKDYREGFGIS